MDDIIKDIHQNNKRVIVVACCNVGSNNRLLTEAIKGDLENLHEVTSITADSWDEFKKLADELGNEECATIDEFNSIREMLQEMLVEELLDEELPPLAKVNTNRNYINHYNNPTKKNWDRHTSRNKTSRKKRRKQ